LEIHVGLFRGPNQLRYGWFQLNCNIPYEVTGEQWEPFKRQKFSSPQDAFEAEQQIIATLAKQARSLGGEMFECDQKIFDTLWMEVIMNYLRPK